MVKAAVFLDRDGVINANIMRDSKPVAPTHIDEFRFLPGVEDAIRRLKDAGYTVVVCTNQPDVATGRTSRATLDAMHRLVREKLKVDDIKVCFHTDRDNCDCRKPKPGMLLAAAHEYGIDLGMSYIIGDRWRDTAAGRAAGCATIFIDYGYKQDGPNAPEHVVASLSQAVDIIVGQCRQSSADRAFRER